MKAVIRYAILAMCTAILIGALSIMPTIYAQSSNTTQTGCPSGKLTGLQCVTKVEPYSLPTGRWIFTATGSSGNLTIKSVDKHGMIVGQLAAGDLCSIPCDLKNASFNDKTGKIGFTIQGILTCKVSILGVFCLDCQGMTVKFCKNSQQYNGRELPPVHGIDTITYEIYGIGKTISPSIGPVFNWTATKTCLVTGCIG